MKKILTSIVVVFISITFIVNCGGEKKAPTKEAPAKKEVKKVADLANGEKVFNKVCVACHLTGVAGAPAVTDKARWEENAAKGFDVLYKSVLNGVPKGKYGVMPPRGTCTDCSDKDLYDAVHFILKKAGVTAKE